MSAAESTCNSSSITQTAPPFYFDEKWKLSKKEGSSSSSSSSSSRRSISPLMKKNSSSSSSSTHHQRKCAFARKCARLVKEQRARFYIMRRCVIMLICWHDHENNDS